MPDSSVPNPLQGLYLTRLYREGSEPFEVVTDKPKTEAIALCSKFASQRRVGDKVGDQAAYIEGRIETENWLRAGAQSAGVDIRKQNPVYFCLTTEPQTVGPHTGLKAISIPADQFDLSCCSFTYGDSMGNHTVKLPEGVEPHPLQNAVLNAEQAAQAIKSFGLGSDYIKGGRYVEIQVWANPAEAAGLKTQGAATPAVSSSLKP
jgi:hypothetical protein